MFIEKGPAQPGSIQALDPYSRMPAGWSLTQPPGKWPWDRPPKYVDPNEAVSYIIDRIEQPEVQEDFIRLMFAGISIQEIVNAVAIGGFSQGFYTPDIAELVKAPVAFYLLGVAAENEIPVKFFATPDGLPVRRRQLDDDALFNIMKERNPEFAKHIMEQLNAESLEPQPKGFLSVSEQMLGSPSEEPMEVEESEEYAEGEEE